MNHSNLIESFEFKHRPRCGIKNPFFYFSFFFGFPPFYSFAPSIQCTFRLFWCICSPAFGSLLVEIYVDFHGSYCSRFLLSYSTMSIIELDGNIEYAWFRRTVYTLIPMRHTKSWHNLIRDLFNYKITAIEHFFVRFVRISDVAFSLPVSPSVVGSISVTSWVLIPFLFSDFPKQLQSNSTRLICLLVVAFSTIIHNYKFVTVPIVENSMEEFMFSMKVTINFMVMNSEKCAAYRTYHTDSVRMWRNFTKSQWFEIRWFNCFVILIFEYWNDFRLTCNRRELSSFRVPRCSLVYRSLERKKSKIEIKTKIFQIIYFVHELQNCKRLHFQNQKLFRQVPNLFHN